MEKNKGVEDVDMLGDVTEDGKPLHILFFKYPDYVMKVIA